MQKVVLQVPVSKQLKDDAEKAAFDQGFSSLQEVLRIFMKKLANKNIDISFKEEEVVQLSKKSEARYLKATDDLKAGKNVYTASSVDDLMRQLHED